MVMRGGEEEVFITSGNWRGKHNSLSRGARRRGGREGREREGKEERREGGKISSQLGRSLGAQQEPTITNSVKDKCRPKCDRVTD